VGALERIPAWATTGIGSLPHNDPSQAVAHLAAAYDVPFCPQLPRLEGDMIAEWLGADPRRCGWSPERDRERPRAWSALLAGLDRDPPLHRVVKLQVTGPATLACEMRVLLSTYGSRGDVEPVVALAVRLRALGAEGCDALVATGVTPAGAWR